MKDSRKFMLAGISAVLLCQSLTARAAELGTGKPGDAEKSAASWSFHGSAKCIETCRRAGELTRQLADNKPVFWLDINPVFLNSDGTINADMLWDLLHPSPAGAEAWV